MPSRWVDSASPFPGAIVPKAPAYVRKAPPTAGAPSSVSSQVCIATVHRSVAYETTSHVASVSSRQGIRLQRNKLISDERGDPLHGLWMFPVSHCAPSVTYHTRLSQQLCSTSNVKSASWNVSRLALAAVASSSQTLIWRLRSSTRSNATPSQNLEHPTERT